MAAKRSTPLDDPPSASSDDEETEDEQEQRHITQKANEESSSTSEEEEEEEESEEETIDAVKIPLEKPKIQNPNSKTAESSSEEESEEDTIDAVKIPLEKPKIQKPNSKTAESSSEEESGSDSEDEIPIPVNTSTFKLQTLPPKSSSTLDSDSKLSSPTASDFAIKPSKKITATPIPEKTPVSKRLSSESDVKDKKKLKLSNGDDHDEKKSVNKRVWSDDDEILLLQGFIAYQSKKGCSPLSDMDGFYQFTMDALPGNATKSQLYEKIRRLKKKFRVNFEKVSANGEDPVFPKPHERKLFEVSKKIWGIDGCESLSAVGVSNPKPKIKPAKVKPKIEVKEVEEDAGITIPKVEDFETLYPYWNAGLNSESSSSLKFPTGIVDLIKENFSLIGEVKAKEMDKKWEALFADELVLRKRRYALLSSVDDMETR